MSTKSGILTPIINGEIEVFISLIFLLFLIPRAKRPTDYFLFFTHKHVRELARYLQSKTLSGTSTMCQLIQPTSKTKQKKYNLHKKNVKQKILTLNFFRCRCPKCTWNESRSMTQKFCREHMMLYYEEWAFGVPSKHSSFPRVWYKIWLNKVG